MPGPQPSANLLINMFNLNLKKMKKLYVFVPAIIPVFVLLLLNSFVTKEKETGEKTPRVTKYYASEPLCDSMRTAPFGPVEKVNTMPVNIVFKSADGGKTWQDISANLPENDQPLPFYIEERNIVKMDEVLIATKQSGIVRSTDNGKHWEEAINEGGVGIAVERINGGFAAISYSTKTETRRVRISLDGGKTWQAIDEGLPPSSFITSIKQMGNYLVCGHPDGIFLSSDMGKTWTKVHPGIDAKVFTLYASGNALYAVAGNAGC